MSAAKVLGVISRLLDRDCEASDAFSVCTQVKTDDAPDSLRLSNSEFPLNLIRCRQDVTLELCDLSWTSVGNLIAKRLSGLRMCQQSLLNTLSKESAEAVLCLRSGVFHHFRFLPSRMGCNNTEGGVLGDMWRYRKCYEQVEIHFNSLKVFNIKTNSKSNVSQAHDSWTFSWLLYSCSAKFQRNSETTHPQCHSELRSRRTRDADPFATQPGTAKSNKWRHVLRSFRTRTPKDKRSHLSFIDKT